MRRVTIIVAAVLVCALAGPAAGPARGAQPPAPARLRSLRGATQAIVVTSASWRTTYAELRTYQRIGRYWRLVRGPLPARIGYAGFSAARHEGDGTTPAGTFGFVYGFGSRPDPGMHGFGWRTVRPGVCWSGRRADYNRWVTRPCTRGEDMWKNARVAYRYGAVIDFNYWRPVYGRGSGIFLHQQTGGPTAGCVSLREADLVAVLRWMRPGVRIVMGPASYVERL
jgi:L,D-peptidoglycan transpeptidase YkuD (ErfK/YbiS/YcfS/YnhG family)